MTTYRKSTLAVPEAASTPSHSASAAKANNVAFADEGGVCEIRTEPVRCFVLCRDEARISQWRARAADLSGVELVTLSGFSSIYAFIRRAMDDCPEPYLVVAHDDVVFGFDFAARVRSLVADLDTRFPNWGVVGNAGVALDRTAHVYVRDPWCRPQRAAGPSVVACVDGNLMLLHRRALLQARVGYPDLGGFHGYDVVLSLECLRAGLLVLADARLAAVHHGGGNHGVYVKFIAGAKFQDWFQSRFADALVPTMLGFHKVVGSLAPTAGEQSCPTLQQLQDAALRAASSGRTRRLLVVDLRECTDAPTLRVPDEWLPLFELSIHRGRDASVSELVRGAAPVSLDAHVWLLLPGTDVRESALPSLLRAITGEPDALVVGGFLRSRGQDETPAEHGARTLTSTIFDSGEFPVSALVVPARALLTVLEEANAEAWMKDGMLLAAALLARTGCRWVPLPVALVSVPEAVPSVASAQDGYGRAVDWAFVDRLAQRDIAVGPLAPSIWALAEETVAAPTPPPEVAWAQDVGQVLHAARQVLRQPGHYLRRGFTLAFGYIARGDFRGLAREARLFRPR